MPPKGIGHAYFMFWDWSDTPSLIDNALHVAMREAIGKETSTIAAVNASQSARSAGDLRLSISSMPHVSSSFRGAGLLNKHLHASGETAA